MAFVRNPVVYVPDLTNGRPIVDGKVYILTAGTVPPMHDSAIDPLDLVTVSYYNEADNLVEQPQPLYTSKGGCLYGNYPDAARQFIISPQAYVFAVYNRIGQLEYSAETTASDYVETNALAAANSTVLIANEEAWKMATKLRSVNCLMFIAPENRAAAISGAYDVGAAVQAAVNAAVSLDLPYLEGAGDYWIGTTNIVSPSTRDLTWKGAGRDLTNYFTDLNNGSKAIAITGQWYDIGEFRITSKSGTKKNFTGLSVGDTVANTSATRSRVRVKASYAAIGVEARGWVTDLDIFTTNCDLGFKGEELNSCTVKLRGEHNAQGFAIDGAIATTFEQLLEENTFTSGTTTIPSYIDNFKSIAISSLYLEGGTFSTTAVNFAPVTQSYGLTIDSVSSEIVPADKTQPIVIDKVHGVAIAGNVYAGGFNATVGFTANARGISPLLTAPPATSSGSNSTMRLQDLSKQIRKADNFSGDPYFTHLVSSFDTVTKTGTTLSADTTNVISGKRSLRIDATTGASFPQVELRRTVNRLPRVANLVGKTVKAFAWVFVPNLTKFADRTYQFGIEISFGGGASLTSSMQRTTLAGQWNLVETPAITAPAGWTGGSTDRFNIRFYVVGNTSAAVDSGYYVVVDSWFLCDGNTSIIDIQRGNFEDFNLLGVSTDGDKLRLVSDNFEGATNADSTFAVGDIIEHAAPAPSGFIGKVCTTAGAVGSTAVFKTYGAISA